MRKKRLCPPILPICHTPFPPCISECIGMWQDAQRTARRRGSLSKSRIALLKKAGATHPTAPCHPPYRALPPTLPRPATHPTAL